MSILASSSAWPSSISGLRGTEMRMLVFPSREEFDKSNHLFVRDEELVGIPNELSPKSMGKGYATALVVPAAAIPLIKSKGLKFRVVEPIAEADLTPAQRKELQREKLYLISMGGKEPRRVFLGKFTTSSASRRRNARR